jgi:hypothetical protein
MMSYLEGDSLLKEIEKSLEDKSDDDIMIEDTDTENLDRFKFNTGKDHSSSNTK